MRPLYLSVRERTVQRAASTASWADGTAWGSPYAVVIRNSQYVGPGSGRNGACAHHFVRRKAQALRSKGTISKGWRIRCWANPFGMRRLISLRYATRHRRHRVLGHPNRASTAPPKRPERNSGRRARPLSHSRLRRRGFQIQAPPSRRQRIA